MKILARSAGLEGRVLALCARPELGRDGRRELEDRLAQGIDWAHLVRRAIAHEVTPLLSAPLHDVAEPLVPADILYALAAHVARNHERNRELARELLELATTARQAGIAIMVLEGPPIAGLAYGSLAGRSSTELRLLVRGSERDPLLELLHARGYRSPAAAGGDAPRRGLARHRADGSCVLARAGNGAVVAVHRGLSPSVAALAPGGDYLHGLWERASSLPLEARSVPGPSLEDLLLVLSMRGAVDGWRRLRTLADIAHLLHARPELELGRALERARAHGVHRLLAASVLAARRMAGTPRAAPAIAVPRAGRSLASRLLTQALAPRRGALAFHALQVRSWERSADRWRHLDRALRRWPEVPPLLRDGAAAGASDPASAAYWDARSGSWERWASPPQPSGLPLDDALLEGAGVRAGSQVLELACGPGITALALAAQVGPHGSVTSTDLAPTMVAFARERLRSAGYPGAAGCVADMQSLPFLSSTFDAVVCRLGIMYCARPADALSEALRVLQPGGRAAYLVCGPMAGNALLAAASKAVPELFGARSAHCPPPFRFAAPGSLAAPMRRAGFVQVEERELRITRTVPATSRFWQPTVELGLGFSLEMLPPGTRAAIERTMLAAVAPGEDDGGYRIESHYRVGVGSRAR